MNETVNPPSAAAGLTITRTFAAPRELVYQAWTQPAHFARWFGGNEASVPVDSVSMDVRTGGAWKALMIAGPDKTHISWKGIYLEVTPPEKLVFTITDQPTDEGEIVSVTLTDRGGQTEMVFTQGGGHLTPEGYAGARSGWLVFFDALDQVLAQP